MAVSQVYEPLVYNGNGSSKSFPVTWEFFEQPELIVTLIAADGTQTVQTISSHYDVTGGAVDGALPIPTPANGTVEMLVAPASGTKVRIERLTDPVQGTTFASNDAFPPKSVEGAYDRRALVEQELRVNLRRAIKQSPQEYTQNGEMDLPAGAAGELIGWNADGDGLENKGTPVNAGVTPVSPFMLTVIDDTTDAAARATLGAAAAADLASHLDDATAAHAASAISFAPAGSIAATNVQTALVELDTEKATTGSVSSVASGLSDHINDTSAAHEASAISFTQAGTGATTRDTRAKGREFISVKDFGATGDGVTVDTTAIQAAETYRASVGGTLFFPFGTYLTGTITVGRANGGAWAGLGAALKANANSTVFMDVSGAVYAASFKEFDVSNLRFLGNGKTGVCVYREATAYMTTLSHLAISEVQYCAIFNRGRGVNIHDIMQFGSGQWSFSGVGTGVSDRIFEVNISNIQHHSTGGQTWSGATAWFYFYRAIGVQMNNVVTASLDGAAGGLQIEGACEGIFVNNTIIVYPTTGIGAAIGIDGVLPAYLYFNNVGVDQPTVTGIDMYGFVVRMSNINVTFGDARTNSGDGIRIQSTAYDVDMRGIRISNMYKSGLVVETGALQVRIGGLVSLNNNAIAGSFYDVDLQASTRANVVMYGYTNFGTSSATGQVIADKGVSAPGGFFPGSGTFASGAAQMYIDANNGLIITGQAGATNDIGLYSPAGAGIIENPTGTSNAVLCRGGGSVGIATAPVSTAFLKIAAGTIAKAQINLPVSSAPTSPVDGDQWRENNTNTGWKIRVNGVTKTVSLV